MALDFDKLLPGELLAAASAVLTMRSLMDAVKTASACIALCLD